MGCTGRVLIECVGLIYVGRGNVWDTRKVQRMEAKRGVEERVNAD